MIYLSKEVKKMSNKEECRMALTEQENFKRATVSSKRQVTIPKKFHDALGIKNEAMWELHGDHLVLKPVKEGFGDFSAEILDDIIKEGYTGDEISKEFRYRKGQLGSAVSSLITEARESGERMTIDDIFEDDDADES